MTGARRGKRRVPPSSRSTGIAAKKVAISSRGSRSETTGSSISNFACEGLVTLRDPLIQVCGSGYRLHRCFRIVVQPRGQRYRTRAGCRTSGDSEVPLRKEVVENHCRRRRRRRLTRTDIDFSRRAPGADINAAHISAALVDADGNPIVVFHFPRVTYGDDVEPGAGPHPQSRQEDCDTCEASWRARLRRKARFLAEEESVAEGGRAALRPNAVVVLLQRVRYLTGHGLPARRRALARQSHIHIHYWSR